MERETVFHDAVAFRLAYDELDALERLNCRIYLVLTKFGLLSLVA